MTQDKVNEMMKNYRTYSGRCKYLDEYIPMLELEIERLKSHLAADLALSSGNSLDGMPHGSGVGKPTEQKGVLLADGYESPELKEKKSELISLRAELAEKVPTVVFVEAWLKGLSERERWIVENQVIDSVTWRELMIHYSIMFGEQRTKRGLQMLRDRAMDKIYEMAC